MLDLVTRMKEVDGGRRRLGLLEVVNPLEAVLPSGRRLQLDFNDDKYQISIQKNAKISEKVTLMRFFSENPGGKMSGDEAW